MSKCRCFISIKLKDYDYFFRVALKIMRKNCLSKCLTCISRAIIESSQVNIHIQYKKDLLIKEITFQF